MKISVNFSHLLLKNSLEELNWLKNEFVILFGKKELYEEDIILARNVLDYFIENLMLHQDGVFLERLSETLKELQSNYPNLFN
ncbi:MAG: hypothetical protein BAJALOKI3v1_1030013 [Promethearchaeota archaeon]|nr:MAG: hypothetical protein BAJALOKI3v1_1030013 [Candidatus Lokiarchaeota archaeon]